MDNLKKIYLDIAGKYSEDNNIALKLFSEIENQYNSPDRYYHNFLHINNIILQLENVKSDIKDWDSIIFSAFYHDFIYNVKSKTNEDDSAQIAKDHLLKLILPQEKVEKCSLLILATKDHSDSTDTDTNLFVDSDLSILGQDIDTYMEYSKQIRKEYGIYPDTVYIQGRISVLNYMLNMDKIYKTDYFYNKLEKSARANIESEIKSLNTVCG